MTEGRIHSIQSLGTVDGPGVRFVVFFQGCPLRCKCCYNPDTWDLSGGKTMTAEEIVEKAKKYVDYFGSDGGITISGGEPLLQCKFATEIFALAHQNGINTCLDTSGCILNDNVKKLLSVTDRVLLDVKYTTDALYRENVGCSIDTPLKFLDYLNKKQIKTTIRQVIIPTINDKVEDAMALKSLLAPYSCVDKIELLSFRKICSVKYDQLKIDFPFNDIPEATAETIEKLNEYLK